MHQGSEQARCTVCGQPGEPSEMHWLHLEGCPRLEDDGAVCTCNPVAHPDCCPVCHRPTGEAER